MRVSAAIGRERMAGLQRLRGRKGVELLDGWSLNRRAGRLVAAHMRTNPAIQDAGPPLAHRLLERLLTRRFGLLLTIYLGVALASVLVEVLVGLRVVSPLFRIPAAEATRIVDLAPGVAITAQTGVLAVITLALALVALVAQRDDAPADVRIYYRQSLAFEIAASCLALVAVLSVQSAWPLHVAAHMFLSIPENVAPKFGLTLLHLGWLLLNVVAVSHFIVVTLGFVQRSSRERMRWRYISRVLFADDLRRRLREPLLAASLATEFPAEGDDGSAVTVNRLPFFGFDGGEPEVVVRLRDPARLVDVNLPLLRWAVRSWAGRAQRGALTAADRPRTLASGASSLRLPIPLDEIQRGDVVLCRRRGGVPMNRMERVAVRMSMRFAQGWQIDGPPTIEQLVEEQVERVLERMRRRASVAFEAELGELRRLHRFLLAASTSTVKSLADVNLVEVSDELWLTPHDRWTWHYRRIFEAAVELIDVDDRYIASVADVIPALLRREEGVALTAGVVDGILKLGPMLMHTVEDWVAHRRSREPDMGGGSVQERPPLGAPERRALSRALPAVVAAWESVPLGATSGFGRRDRREPAERWDEMRAAWPTLRNHLARTAYCLAIAVWNGDEEGATLFRQALAGWPADTLSRLGGRAELKFARLLMPDVLDLPWQDALAHVEPLSWPGSPLPKPEELFSTTLQGARRDVATLTAELLLLWAATARGASGIGPRVARELLDRGDHDPADGAPSPSPTFARTSFDLLRIRAAGERHRRGAYGDFLDDLLRRMESATERRTHRGRAFNTDVVHDRAGLDAIEVALLATVPTGAGNVAAGLAELARAPVAALGGDGLLRDASRRIVDWIAGLEEPGMVTRRAAEALGGWPADGVDAIALSLRDGMAAIEEARADRLRAEPVDPARLEALRAAAEEALRAADLDLGLFHSEGAKVDDALGSASAMTFTYPDFEKGQLTEPELAYPVPGIAARIGDLARRALADRVTSAFFARPREIRETEAWLADPAFWRLVAALAPVAGHRPALLVDHRDLRLIGFQAFSPSGSLAGLTQVHDRAAKSRLEAYRSTIDGVDILGAQLGPGVAILFSGEAVRVLTLAPPEGGGLVEVEWLPNETGALIGELHFRSAVSMAFDERPCFELRREQRLTTPPAPARPPERSVWSSIVEAASKMKAAVLALADRS